MVDKLDVQYHNLLLFFRVPQHLKHLIVHNEKKSENCWVTPINKIEITIYKIFQKN